MYLTFMSEDVQVWIKKDSIVRIECCGDRLAIVDAHGEKTYEYVCGIHWLDQPKITWPDLVCGWSLQDEEVAA